MSSSNRVNLYDLPIIESKRVNLYDLPIIESKRVNLYDLPKEMLIKIILSQGELAKQYVDVEECNAQLDFYIQRLRKLLKESNDKLEQILISTTGEKIAYIEPNKHIDFRYQGYYIRLECNRPVHDNFLFDISGEIDYSSDEENEIDEDYMELSRETLFVMFPAVKKYFTEMCNPENKELFLRYSKIQNILYEMKYR